MPEPTATEENLHLIESEEARASADPERIKGLYHSYGGQLRETFIGREDEVPQHGSRRVAAWQGANLPTEAARVLDVGCGPRPEASFRMARPGRTIVCSDISYDLVVLAREIARHQGLDGIAFVVADAEGLPFRSEAFGLICADDVIEHVPHPDMLVAECARVAAPDGLVSISTPNRRAISVFADKTRDLLRGRLGPAEKYYLVPSHLREYTRRELRELCGRFFGRVGFAAVGWDGDSALKRAVSWITTRPLLHGISRHWIVLLRRPTRA